MQQMPTRLRANKMKMQSLPPYYDASQIYPPQWLFSRNMKEMNGPFNSIDAYLDYLAWNNLLRSRNRGNFPISRQQSRRMGSRSGELIDMVPIFY